jgi:hypothetical protein
MSLPVGLLATRHLSRMQLHRDMLASTRSVVCVHVCAATCRPFHLCCFDCRDTHVLLVLTYADHWSQRIAKALRQYTRLDEVTQQAADPNWEQAVTGSFCLRKHAESTTIPGFYSCAM